MYFLTLSYFVCISIQQNRIGILDIFRKSKNRINIPILTIVCKMAKPMLWVLLSKTPRPAPNTRPSLASVRKHREISTFFRSVRPVRLLPPRTRHFPSAILRLKVRKSVGDTTCSYEFGASRTQGKTRVFHEKTCGRSVTARRRPEPSGLPVALGPAMSEVQHGSNDAYGI